MEKDAIEFTIVKEYIRPFLTSPYGLHALTALVPFDSWEEAQKRWRLLKEMMCLIQQEAPLHFEHIPDILPLLEIASKKGIILEGQDLIMLSSVLKNIASLGHDLSLTQKDPAALVKDITPFASLTEEIDLSLEDTGEISDNANPILKDLRLRFRATRASVLERLETMLKKLKPHSIVMEDIITTRNGRFVIPLSHDYGSYLKGITHDYSRTRHTVYVEPLEVIEHNNNLSQLKVLIRDEELKVLKHLTSLIWGSIEQIHTNLNTYGRLDLIHACALWALETNSTIPNLISKGISLKKARHPILSACLGPKGVVPVDISVPGDKNCLVISGPNAGGKTVALKTLGLLITMAKSGLAIPAHSSSQIPPIGRIWVEMDNNQDIRRDLSSFSAHALALKHIYEHVSPGDLILLDEPGASTDPDQGGAIAVACIDAFRKKGAYVITASHLGLVKMYGISHKGVITATTTFDDENIKPLYKLEYGTIGRSKAFEIMESIDFPKGLIDEAKSIASGKTGTALAKALADISHTSLMRKQASHEVEKSKELREKAEKTLLEIERLKLQSALKYKRLLDEIDRLPKVLQTKADRDDLKGITASPEALELEAILKEEIEPLAKRALNLETGAEVRMIGTDTKGIISSISGNTAELICGSKKITIGIDQIEALSEDTLKTSSANIYQNNTCNIPKSMVLPVVVVGLHVDEALSVVEKAIDDAIISGQDKLEIIHGSGTGRLKNAIRDYLKDLSYVRELKDATITEGGGNKTIVSL
ncbi:MAG: Smr/MutS family protein [Thermodesulfobacteriota bacterium]|nr:Smr/MutS family protein [Thermodesulfobacteriota bacterium]